MMETTIGIIERLKHELKYNTGPAIPYVKVGTSDLTTLLNMAEELMEIRKLQEKTEHVESNYELITCSACREEEHVERGTGALAKGMCATCYSVFQGN